MREDLTLRGILEHAADRLREAERALNAAKNVIAQAQITESSNYKLPAENCENCKDKLECEVSHLIVCHAIAEDDPVRWKSVDVDELAGAIAHACKFYEKKEFIVHNFDKKIEEVAG